MNLLLDTHAFLWFVLGDSRLSSEARQHIESLENKVYVSPAIYWELAIKISIGKYVLQDSYESFIDRGMGQNGFITLPVEPRHTAILTTLPFHHRDPFDRLIIAQAIVEGLSVVSLDTSFDSYPVNRIW
ncbi:MAG: type II toxin-antitoxin system VapC family toxin [Acidobacteriota bacterium]|nr:MAG: type II toxin-antitoxin system VapC family toxin [Acidobacteriota bacterium]